jgi:hypothetical protein
LTNLSVKSYKHKLHDSGFFLSAIVYLCKTKLNPSEPLAMDREALVVGINRYPLLRNQQTKKPQHLEKPAADAEAIAFWHGVNVRSALQQRFAIAFGMR